MVTYCNITCTGFEIREELAGKVGQSSGAVLGFRVCIVGLLVPDTGEHGDRKKEDIGL